MADRMYDGTSAYKIQEYDNYISGVEKEQEEKKVRSERRSLVNHRKIAVVTCVVFCVAIAFLYANVVLIQTATKHDNLVKELGDMRDRNTQVSFEIASAVDLAEVEMKAKTEFGMQQPESHQNVYVEVVQSDYSEAVNAVSDESGVVEKMINGVKAFLAYIG